jgi:hypothetical protein
MLCGKHICANHLHMKHDGPQCPDCAVIGMDSDEASRRGLDSSYYRHSSNSHTDTDTYNSSDYDSFDSTAAEGGDSGGGGADGGWDDGDADSTGVSDSDSAGAADFQDS